MVKPSRSKKSSGFTLIELLVVITILGILATIVLVNINIKKRKNDAENAVIKANIIELSKGLESYHIVTGMLPRDDYGMDNHIPTVQPGTTPLTDYVRAEWPDNYEYWVDHPSGHFAVYAPKAGSPGVYIKYISIYGTIKECGTPPFGYNTCVDPPAE